MGPQENVPSDHENDNEEGGGNGGQSDDFGVLSHGYV
jgi:hypothetical protein